MTRRQEVELVTRALYENCIDGVYADNWLDGDYEEAERRLRKWVEENLKK